MAKYEIADDVKKAILEFIGRAPIQGSEAPVVLMIQQVLSNPLKEEKKK